MNRLDIENSVSRKGHRSPFNQRWEHWSESAGQRFLPPPVLTLPLCVWAWNRRNGPCVPLGRLSGRAFKMILFYYCCWYYFLTVLSHVQILGFYGEQRFWMGKWHSKSQILSASYQHYLVEALGSHCSAWDFPRFQAQGWEQEEGPGAEGERAKGTEPATTPGLSQVLLPSLQSWVWA